MKNITINKQKNKHFSLTQLEYIINKVNSFNSFSPNKKRNTGKTQFMKALACEVNTSLSNLYSIIADAAVTVLDSHLKEHIELSASAAYNKRSRKSVTSNICKRDKADNFINLVINEIKSNKLASIDETINNFKLNNQEDIQGMPTVCTATFYRYVHLGLVDLKPIDLPRMVSRKKKPNKYKSYIPKRQKGTSITERPFDMNDRSEFGHWEGDLVTGPRDGQNGAYLTLIERKTRFYYMIPISSKSSKKVYMQINRLNKLYGEQFSNVFKSITFDNGNEFARWKDIEVKPGTNKQRTKIYFGRPYRSSDRGSNENCNSLIRRFVKKGTDINQISKEKSQTINDLINKKKRKIHNYLSSESLFLNELKQIGLKDMNNLYLN